MSRAHVLASVVSLAACGAPAASRPVGNQSPDPPAVTEVAVDPSKPIGWLALPAGAERPDDAPYWMAKSPTAAAVVPIDAQKPAPLEIGARVVAIPAGGDAPFELTAGAPTTIGYGCDQTDLHVVPLTGPAMGKPGLLWLLPAPVAGGWSPSSRAFAIQENTREERRISAGDVELTTTRVDATHMTLRIAVGGRVVHEERAETYLMTGAEPIDLDMTQGHFPGIPTPEAVFSFGDGGPYLVVLDRSGYEGVAFETLLLQHGKAREIESLGLSAYYCAF